MFSSLKENKIGVFLLLMIIAYGFSLAVRMIWVYQFQGNTDFYWNSQLMINTNDGYYYAEGARDIIKGLHQENDLSPIDTPLAQVTAFLASLLPFSFETIILWMPAFFGSLLIVPILLISRALKEETAGFIAALMAGIVWSYYNRTMVGYYDTDMLSVVLPTFVLWSLVFNIQEQRNRYLPLVPFFIILNAWWYPQSYSVTMAMIIMLGLYTLAFERKGIFNYKVLLVMIIALAHVAVVIKVVLILMLFLLFHFKKELVNFRVLALLLALSIGLVAYTGGFSPVIAQLKDYVFKDAVTSDTSNLNLHYFSVVQTVREAGQIPFETFANRISGHPIIFLFSLIGYLFLLIRYRVMLLTLPLVGLGFVAYVGGLRFTVYAVPIMALSIGYLITQAAGFMQKNALRYLFLLLGTTVILWPNISHVIDYRVPTVFSANEVEVLDRLGKTAQREDYVMTWWDFGYPIRYYSDVKTLVDGGKHEGDVNFPVSFSLSRPLLGSANMARLDVEYTEMAYKQKRKGSYLEMMMEDYNISDSDDFLELLSSGDLKLPAKTREVYYYLPLRMLDIFPTVMLFSNIDLKSGKTASSPFFYQSAQFQQRKNILDLGRGVEADLEKGILAINNQQVKINMFVSTQYDNTQKLHVGANKLHEEGEVSVIYMKSYNRFLVMDKAMFNSAFIQLFVLEQYDKTLFEEVIMTPMAKVYRLRI